MWIIDNEYVYAESQETRHFTVIHLEAKKWNKTALKKTREHLKLVEELLDKPIMTIHHNTQTLAIKYTKMLGLDYICNYEDYVIHAYIGEK